VVGDVAAPLDFDDLDPPRGELRSREEKIRLLCVPAERDDRVVLAEDPRFRIFARGDARVNPTLQRQDLAIRTAAEVEQSRRAFGDGLLLAKSVAVRLRSGCPSSDHHRTSLQSRTLRSGVAPPRVR